MGSSAVRPFEHASGDGWLARCSVVSLGVLLLAAWLLGGATQDRTWHDEAVQLLALPVLLLAWVVLLRTPPRTRLARTAVAVALAGFALVALQLLPLPFGLGVLSAPRQALVADLARAGVAHEATRWSLAPYATEESLWRMLPALAGFFGGLILARQQRRGFLLAIIALTLANAVLAFQQVGLPEDSPLRLYPSLGSRSAFSGIFVNRNHFATALIVAMALAVALAVDSWRRRMPGDARNRLRTLALAAAAALCLFAAPVTASRAGMVLVLPALAACLLFCGIPRLEWIGRRPALAGLAAAAGLAVVGFALHVMALARASEDLRFPVASNAFHLGLSYLPWGSGAGSFTSVFETDLPQALWIAEYFNHPHNEYALWLLVGGLPAVVLLACALVVLALAGLRILRQRGQRSAAVQAAGCWVAIAAALMHSWVDYPLGTTALATTVALLAGALFSCLEEISVRSGDKS